MTSDESAEAPLRYDSAKDLIAEREFTMAITTYRYEAHLAGRYVFPPDGVSDGEVDFDIASRAEGPLIGLRIEVGFEREYGSAHVDIGVNYKFDVPVELTPEASQEFYNRVAFMALYPYVRESFSSLTHRVFGDAVMLEPVKQGDFVILREEEVELATPGGEA